MEKQNQIAIVSHQRYLQNISNPISEDFRLDVLKMNDKNLVSFILDTKPVSIYKLHKKEQEKTTDIIMLMLIQFQDFYNCKTKMDKIQLLETANIIIQQFRHFNYYDIGYALKQAKMNHKIYDRVDGGMILEYLTLHDITRTGLIVTERENQKAQQNSEWSALSERSSVQRLKDYLK